MKTAPALTWALVVATKDRLETLSHALRLALTQSRPPAEVIVADASADWDTSRDAIIAIVADHPGITLRYLKAERPSAAVQRNQGIAAATADILFLIDDDSFLYPDAAAEVMRLYEADLIEDVAGIQMLPAPKPPGEEPNAPRHARSGLETVAARPSWRRRLLRQMLSYGPEGSFVPYDGAWPDQPVPDALSGFDVKPARVFEGFRMTLRRRLAARLLFDPLLLYYSPGEDLDLSFRASREGALLTARSARVHHYTSQGGRLKRRQVELLSTLNQALFLRRNARDQRQARRRYLRWALHRAFAGLLADLAQRRMSLPKLRGCLAALSLSGQVFRADLQDLEQLYPDLQERVVRG